MVAFPSWPLSLAPQQETVLLAKRAQLCDVPVAIAAAPSPFCEPKEGADGAEVSLPPQAERIARHMTLRKALLHLYRILGLQRKATALNQQGNAPNCYQFSYENPIPHK